MIRVVEAGGVAAYLPGMKNFIPFLKKPPLVPVIRLQGSIGTGRKWERLSFDFAYQFGLGPNRTVSGSASSATGQSADGDYEFVSHALMISMGFHF